MHPASMVHAPRGLVVALLAALATGCVPLPIPHAHQQTPEIRGRLHRSGIPLPHVMVTRRAEWSSETLRDGAQTDEDGRFVLPGQRSIHPGKIFWIAGIAHHRYAWEVCFEAPPAGELCWKDSAYTPGEAPQTVRIDCDLDRVALAQTAAEGGATPAERRADYACRSGGAGDDR